MPANYNLFLKGYVGDWDFSADQVDYVLNKHKGSQVNVLIDSLGGRVDTALSISSLFKLHGNVHCHYVGMNASAATIASMGAKHVSIDANALFLVHKCMSAVLEWDWMNADELEAHIAELQKTKADNDTIDGCIAGLYASRCKRPKEDLLALMKEGAWLTAKQALDWGFVDEITDQAEDEAPVVTDAVADALAKSGIPMPPSVSPKKGSFLERLLALFQSKETLNPNNMQENISLQPTEEVEEVTAQVEESPAEEAATDIDGQEAPAEQPAEEEAPAEDNLAEQLAASRAEVESLNARIAELQAQLDAAPGATTSQVTTVQTENSEFISPSSDPVADAAAILKQLI